MRDRKVEVPELQNAMYNGKPAKGWTSYTVFKCSQCKRIKQSVNPYTTGYGKDRKGHKLCFECCGLNDRKDLLKTGKSVLYISKRDGRYIVTNWPDTLNIAVSHVSISDHNFAGRNGRTDVWFWLDGFRYHGVNIGDNQILRINRVKN